MSTKSEQLNWAFQEGCRVKELARKGTNQLELYIEAATLMKTASTFASEIASDPSFSADERFDAQVCGLYYLSEHHSCLGTYYYEKRDTTTSKGHQQEALKALSEAIVLLENIPGGISEATSNRLKERLPTWKYIRKVDNASIEASEARRAWDAGNLVDALDHYRHAARIQMEAIPLTEQFNLSLSYRRIAIGNYLGMMANASNVLTQIILQKGTIRQEGTAKLISSDAAIDLIRYAIDSYKLTRQAFDENPEWNQFRELAATCVRNIQNFLNDNKSSWLTFYIALEHEPEFLRIMKMTDLQQYKSAEIERHFKENKVAKLWLIGSFWILSASVLTALVMYITKSGFSWWQLLIALSAIETLLLMIIASTLRPLGDLSEEGFLKLVGVALKYQFKFFRLSTKQDDQNKGNDT